MRLTGGAELIGNGITVDEGKIEKARASAGGGSGTRRTFELRSNI